MVDAVKEPDVLQSVLDKNEAPLSKPISKDAVVAPLSKTYAGYDPDQMISGAYDMLSKSLDSRTQRPTQIFDPTLMAMAQGFLAPTKTGSFGESAGYASGKVGEAELLKQSQWDADQKRIQDNAMMRLSLGKEAKSGLAEQNMQTLMGQLHQQDENGMWVLNPQAAQQLAVLTRKPEYSEMIIADQKRKTYKEIGNDLFKINDATQKYDFNPSALNRLIKISDDPATDLAKYAKLIPEMRKAGMINGLDGDVTPFDAIIASPSIAKEFKDQAQLLANKVKRGLIDPDKADALAKDMMTAAISHMDREQQREAVKEQHAIMNLLASNAAGARNESARERADIARQRLEETQKQNEGKLNDTQKMQYKTVVLPVIQEGVKATAALADVEALKGYINRAPSGVASSIASATYGRLFNTDQNTAMREIEASQKKMLTSIPRLPGSASNLDAKNLEASIGKLTDWSLDANARRKLVLDIENGFKNLQTRAISADQYWEDNKKIHPDLLAGTKPPEDKGAGNQTAAKDQSSKPVPTAADRARGKSNPESRARFKAHFGVEP